MTITIPVEAFFVYFLIGAVLWLPLEWRAWRSVHQRKQWPFWRGLWNGLKARPYVPLIMVVAWPLAVWQEIR